MNDNNTQTLFSRYPRLYRGRMLGIQESSMSWGFQCGDGWFELVERLSAKIEEECRRLQAVEGWEETALPIAIQVKEKLGTLRFRMSVCTPEIEAMIADALTESQSINEHCRS